MRCLLRVLSVLAACMLPVASVSAADHYVATTGSNSNDGSIGTPWLTLAYAMASAQSACGDTIYVRAGTYASIDTQSAPARSCASFASPLTVRAYANEAVHLPSLSVYVERYLIFQDLILDGACNGCPGETLGIAGGYPTYGGGAGYLRFINLDIHGPNTVPTPIAFAPAVVTSSRTGAGHNEWLGGRVHHAAGTAGDGRLVHGFYLSTPGNLIDGVEIDHVDGYAIQLYDDALPTMADNVVRNNWIHDNGKATATTFAMVISWATDTQVYNNVIVHNANGVDLGGTSVRTLFDNNTLARNGISGAGSDYGGSTTCPGSVDYCTYPALLVRGTNDRARNNIAYGNYSDTLGDFGSGTVASNNLFTNPTFLNGTGTYEEASDFNIASTSAARDTGTTVATVTSDYIGTSRPQNLVYDIGAFEYIVSSGGGGVPCTTTTTFAIVSSSVKGSSNGTSVTTDAVNTAAGCLTAVFVGTELATGTLTDNYLNTWIARATYTTPTIYGQDRRITLYDCDPCLVGPAQTFTVETDVPGVPAYPTIGVISVAGVTTSPFDGQNGHTEEQSLTTTTGALLPSQDNTVLLTAVVNEAASATIGSSFTLLATWATTGTNLGMELAYLQQGSAASVNPTWTMNVMSDVAATLAVYTLPGAPAPLRYRLRKAGS